MKYDKNNYYRYPVEYRDLIIFSFNYITNPFEIIISIRY